MYLIGNLVALLLASSGSQAGDYTQQTPARLLRPIASLVTSRDYPAAARARGEQGLVGFEVEISEQGRAVGCTVVATSGSRSLDETTCRIVRARGQFLAARDMHGRAVTSLYRGSLTWLMKGRSNAPVS
jgi:TonB family protein